MEAFRTCLGGMEAIEEKFIGVESRVSRVRGDAGRWREDTGLGRFSQRLRNYVLFLWSGGETKTWQGRDIVSSRLRSNLRREWIE